MFSFSCSRNIVCYTSHSYVLFIGFSTSKEIIANMWHNVHEIQRSSEAGQDRILGLNSLSHKSELIL